LLRAVQRDQDQGEPWGRAVADCKASFGLTSEPTIQ
jgi:hypothetical protein